MTIYDLIAHNTLPTTIIRFTVEGEDSMSIRYFYDGKEQTTWQWDAHSGTIITPDRRFTKEEARALWRDIVLQGWLWTDGGVNG
jgi:hypothetical protein